MKRKPSKICSSETEGQRNTADNGTKTFVHGVLLIKLFFYPFGSSSDEYLSWNFSSCQRSRKISDDDEDVWGRSFSATPAEMITDDLKLQAWEIWKTGYLC